jgi:hypothetical protein
MRPQRCAAAVAAVAALGLVCLTLAQRRRWYNLLMSAPDATATSSTERCPWVAADIGRLQKLAPFSVILVDINGSRELQTLLPAIV